MRNKLLREKKLQQFEIEDIEIRISYNEENLKQVVEVFDKKFNQEDLFYEVEIPLIKEIINMQYNGFLIDYWKASTILSGLGFNKTDQSKPLSDFSGGHQYGEF